MDLFNVIASQAYAGIPESVPEDKTDKHPFAATAKPQGGVAEHTVPAYMSRCWHSRGMSLCGLLRSPKAPSIGAVTCSECKEQLLTAWCSLLGGQDLTINRKSGAAKHRYTPNDAAQELGVEHEAPMRATDFEAMRDYLSSMHRALGLVLGATR